MRTLITPGIYYKNIFNIYTNGISSGQLSKKNSEKEDLPLKTTVFEAIDMRTNLIICSYRVHRVRWIIYYLFLYV